MNVASLELCKELYELSGWPSELLIWSARSIDGKRRGKHRVIVDQNKQATDSYPAYDLGYLLRKLPALLGKRGSSSAEGLRLAKDKDKYLAGYIGVDLVWGFPCEADTPEDATCKLAIELFKQGVLK